MGLLHSEKGRRVNSAIATVGTAGALNLVYAVRKGSSLPPVLMGTAFLMAICVGLDDLTKTNLGSVIGGTFLVGTLVYRGKDIVAVMNALIDSGKE